MAEFLQFILCQLQLNDLLDAALGQHRRHADRHAVHPILTLQNAGDRQRPVAAGEDIATDFSDGGGDAVFGPTNSGGNVGIIED